MNPIINQMMSGFMDSIGKLFGMVKNAQNPQAMMQSMMQTNPKLNEVMSFINQNGGNAKKLFYDTCKQHNVDPNIIIDQLKNM